MAVSVSGEFVLNKALLRQADVRAGLVEAATLAGYQALLHWFDTYLPEHFKESSPQRYPGKYTPRVTRTQAGIDALKRLGKYGRARGRVSVKRAGGYVDVLDPFGRVPMVETGATYETLTQNRPKVEMRRHSRTAKITLRLPHAPAINLWSGTNPGGPHNFPVELTAVNTREARKRDQILRDEFKQRAAKWFERGRRAMVRKKFRG